MNLERLWSHRLRNLFHSFLLLAGMLMLLAESATYSSNP